MDLKYYDLLSSAIIGIIVVAIVNYLFFENLEIISVVYVSLGVIAGYFVNAIGSSLECFFYKCIGGKPSDKLLTLVSGQNWTGYKRVKFYESEKVVSMLKTELADSDASVHKMFNYAIRKVNSNGNSRVSTFNAHYAMARTILTATLLIDVFCAFRFYREWAFWAIAIGLLALSFKRFKERGYYYAREVLNEFLNR